MTYLRIVPLLIFIVILFAACRPDYIFEKRTPIENNRWTYSDTLNYTFDIADTNQYYNFYLDLEHLTNYPHQNIYLMIHTLYPSGKRIAQRLSIDLADKTGRWYGKCGAESCQLRVNLQEKAYFNELGSHTLTLEQYMRLDPLPAIQSVALRIERLQQTRN